MSILEEIQKQDVPYLLYGESAGGTLAAGLALWTRDHETKPANGQCLIYPVLDNRCSRYASMRLYSEAAWPLKNNLTMWRAYLKNGKDSLDNYIVPMTAPDVSSLSPAYVEPQQIDTLRDEAIAYAKRLVEAGNHVTLNTVSRVPTMVLMRISETPLYRKLCSTIWAISPPMSPVNTKL